MAEEKALQRQFEQAEQRFEVGLTAVTDVHEARASYDNARARVIVARNNLNDTKEGLRELTGRYFETLERLKADVPLVIPNPGSADEWVDLAMVNSPVVISRQMAADAAEANIKLQKSGYFPTLDLVANYTEFDNNEFRAPNDLGGTGSFSTKLDNDSYNISLQLNVPLYTGGAVTSRSRQARR